MELPIEVRWLLMLAGHCRGQSTAGSTAPFSSVRPNRTRCVQKFFEYRQEAIDLSFFRDKDTTNLTTSKDVQFCVQPLMKESLAIKAENMNWRAFQKEKEQPR